MATLAEARLRACKLWPYGSHAVLSLTPVARPGLGTMAVDQRWRVYYDPQALAGWTVDEGAGVVLHELAHLLFKHYARAPKFLGGLAGDREFNRWNQATDLAINGMLAKEGVPLPAGVLYPEGFGFEHSLSAETYYRLLEGRDRELQPEKGAGGDDGQGDGEPDDSTDGEDAKGDEDAPESAGDDSAESDDAKPNSGGDASGGNPGGGVAGGGAGDGDPSNGSDREPAPDSNEGAQPQPGCGSGGSCADGQERPWELPADSETPGLAEHEADMLRREVAERIEQKGRGDGAGGFGLWAREIISPRIDPRTKLLIHVRAAVDQVLGVGDYTYRRPSRRSISPDAPLPASMCPVPRIAVLVDTSGSMDQRDLGLALGLVGKVLKALPNRNGVRVLCGDAALQTARRVFDPKQVHLAGGGGTDMGALIEDAAAERPAPQLIIVVTDGVTPWPKAPTRMPVVACLTRVEHPRYAVPTWMRTVSIC